MNTREKLAFNNEAKKNKFLKNLINSKHINEAIILSTCNRIEIITSVTDVYLATNFIIEKLYNFSTISTDELQGRADIFEDNGAIHHLFTVASSLDSLVIGETQITGQLKDAFKYSYDNSYSSQKLSRAIHYAFKCAASVRNSTDISKNPVSVSSVAVSKAKHILGGNLGGFSAIVVGAGEMAQLAIKHLIKADCNIILVNRDMKKAQELANKFGEMVMIEPYSKLSDLLNRYRLLFSATGAPHTIITNDMIENIKFNRYWFDIAMPRDIDNIIDKNIDVYYVDDLQDIINNNLSLRDEQAKIAYRVVGKFTVDFYKWLQSLSIEPLIKSMRKDVDISIKKELHRCIKKGYIKKEEKKNIEKIMKNAFNKFLHKPTINLKKISEEPMADTIIESMKFIFNSDKDIQMVNKYKCEHNIK